MFRICRMLLCLHLSVSGFCQNKFVAVIGSSTAAGTGASVPDSSWVRRLSNHYKLAGVLDTIYNRAKPGLNSYHGMPTFYSPPPGRPAPMPDSNITRAISFNPDVILITFVSNNFDTYSIEEIKTTLFTIFDSATAAGKVAFVSTTQPRTGFSDAGRLRLRKLKDSIIKWFGNYSINFWNPIADSSDNTIAAQYRYASDNVHINNAGHRVLSEQVLAKDIFNVAFLPIRLLKFTGVLRNNQIQLQWAAESGDLLGEFHLQKSKEGRNFETIEVVKAKKGNHVYSSIDLVPYPEKSFYRLEVHEHVRVYYSGMLTIQTKSDYLAVASIYPVPAGNILHLILTGTRRGEGSIEILTMTGSRVQTFRCLFDNDSSQINLPLHRLAKGSYYFRVHHPGSDVITQSFQKY